MCKHNLMFKAYFRSVYLFGWETGTVFPDLNIKWMGGCCYNFSRRWSLRYDSRPSWNKGSEEKGNRQSYIHPIRE